MANCTTIDSKPSKLYRSTVDGTYLAADLIAGIKTMTNSSHSYNDSDSEVEYCMDGNTIPATASTTEVTYGEMSLSIILLPAQHSTLLGDADLRTELFWQIEYSDGATETFAGRVNGGISEDFSGDYITTSITLKKTSKSVRVNA